MRSAGVTLTPALQATRRAGLRRGRGGFGGHWWFGRRFGWRHQRFERRAGRRAARGVEARISTPEDGELPGAQAAARTTTASRASRLAMRIHLGLSFGVAPGSAEAVGPGPRRSAGPRHL